MKAGEWSTICLPFDMTAEQVQTAFGDDVALGDFTGYDVAKENNVIVGITINFDACHGYRGQPSLCHQGNG